MFPFIRLIRTTAQSIGQSIRGNTLSLQETGEITLRCTLGDIDNFFEMNNGRILTLFDLGRTDFAIRSGLGKQLLKQKWGLVVAGSTIQYRRRVRLHDQVTIKTRIAAIDPRWIYVEQSMWVNGKPCSSALLRTAVTQFSTGKTIPTADVLQALGHPDWKLPPDQWVQAWIDADQLRPFPQAEQQPELALPTATTSVSPLTEQSSAH